MPLPPGHLEAMLDRWESAGIIDAEQGRRILIVEAGRETRATETPREQGSMPSGTELLAYLGVLVALAGVLTLVYASGARLALVGALTFIVGSIALIGAREFHRRDSAASMRAAGACGALGATAIGAAAGEFAAAASLFARTVVVAAACSVPAQCPGSASTDQSGNVLLGAGVARLIAFALLRRLPARPIAVVGAAATAVATVAGLNTAQLTVEANPVAVAALFVGAGAILVGYAASLRAGGTAALLGCAGVIWATIPLYFAGHRGGVHLDVAGGVIAVAALAAGVARRRAGVAYGGVVGVAGLVVDIGVSNFSTPTSLGIFFSAAGVASVGALVAATRLRRGRQERAVQTSRG